MHESCEKQAGRWGQLRSIQFIQLEAGQLDDLELWGAPSGLVSSPTSERTELTYFPGWLSFWCIARRITVVLGCGQIILSTRTLPPSGMKNPCLVGRLLPNDLCLPDFTAISSEINLHFSLSESRRGVASPGPGVQTLTPTHSHTPTYSPAHTDTLPTVWFGASQLTASLSFFLCEMGLKPFISDVTQWKHLGQCRAHSKSVLKVTRGNGEVRHNPCPCVLIA